MKWIDVKDGLPDEKTMDEYDIFIVEGKRIYYCSYRFDDYFQCVDSGGWSFRIHVDNISHWMIAIPPKQE